MLAIYILAKHCASNIKLASFVKIVKFSSYFLCDLAPVGAVGDLVSVVHTILCVGM